MSTKIAERHRELAQDFMWGTGGKPTEESVMELIRTVEREVAPCVKRETFQEVMTFWDRDDIEGGDVWDWLLDRLAQAPATALAEDTSMHGAGSPLSEDLR